jgi:OOP family OmpA-OmpF porin
MGSQRTVLGLVIAFATVGSIEAQTQTQGSLRWRAGSAPLGLQAAGSGARLPCTSYTLSCSDSATVPLYASVTSPRSLSMQVSAGEQASALRLARTPGLNVSVVGKAGIAADLGVYGRVGTTLNRAAPLALAGTAAGDGGLTYGVGLSWDFSRSASAAVGLDSYDVRGLSGDSRELRTSLGLQWRY